MTAAELLERAERRAKAVRLSRGGIQILAAVALVLFVYWRGRNDGRASVERASLNDSLAQNATALHVAAEHRDSTKHVAEIAVARSDTMRKATRATRATFRVVDSNTVAVQRPVVDSTGTVTLIDSLAHVPAELVVSVTRSDAQIMQDSIAIVAQSIDIRALEVKDSLHVDRERMLTEQVKVESHHAFWRGAKVGAVAVVVVRGAVWVLAHR